MLQNKQRVYTTARFKSPAASGNSVNSVNSDLEHDVQTHPVERLENGLKIIVCAGEGVGFWRDLGDIGAFA